MWTEATESSSATSYRYAPTTPIPFCLSFLCSHSAVIVSFFIVSLKWCLIFSPTSPTIGWLPSISFSSYLITIHSQEETLSPPPPFCFDSPEIDISSFDGLTLFSATQRLVRAQNSYVEEFPRESAPRVQVCVIILTIHCWLFFFFFFHGSSRNICTAPKPSQWRIMLPSN